MSSSAPFRRRPRGRPPLDPDDPSVSVHVRLVSKQYDVLYRRAKREGASVAATLRHVVQTGLRTTK